MTAPAQEQSVVCPQCGQDNLPGTAFCDNCGAELPLPQPTANAAAMPPTRMNPDEGSLSVAPSPAQAPQAAAPSAAPMACTNCGSQLPLNAKFCMECGTRVPPPPVEPQMVRPTHCQNCASELLPTARFCMECGTPVELVPVEQVQASAAPALPFVAPAQAVQPPPTMPPPAPNEQQPVAQPAPMMEQPGAVMASQEEPTQSVPTMQPRSGNGEYAAPVAQPAELAMPITQQHAVVEAPPMLEQVPTPAAQPSRAPRPRPLPRLVTSDGQELALPHAGEVLVGRADPVSGITPDVDLTPHGGEAAGVSRRHAVLQPTQDGWQVVDLDSTNATRVNGQRVVPHTPTPVQSGDTVRFGRIEVRFEQAELEPEAIDAPPPMNAVPAPPVDVMAPLATNEESAASKLRARVYNAPSQNAAPAAFAESVQPAPQQLTPEAVPQQRMPEPAPQAIAPEIVQQPASLPPVVEHVPLPAQPTPQPSFVEQAPVPVQQPPIPSAVQPTPQSSFVEQAPQPSFVEQAPIPVQQPSVPQRPLPRLMLRDGHSLVLPHVGEVLVGRADPVSGITPDVDLTPHGGEAAGVSRRHAVLQPTQDGWQVVDLDSTNATRVNGQRVVPHTPTPVQSGDTVRFGRIEMTFEV